MKSLVYLCIIAILVTSVLSKKRAIRSRQSHVTSVTGQAPVQGSNMIPQPHDRNMFPTPGQIPSLHEGVRHPVLISHAGLCPTKHGYNELLGSERGYCNKLCNKDECSQLHDRCCYYSRFIWNMIDNKKKSDLYNI